MHKSILVVGALLMFGVILVPAISGEFATAPTGTQTVDNESIEISTSDWSTVSESEAAADFYGNTTVYENGSTVNESAYEWRTDDGSIRAVSGASLEDADRVFISYAYEADDDFVDAGAEIFWFVFIVISMLTLVAGGMFLISTFGGSPFSAGGGR